MQSLFIGYIAACSLFLSTSSHAQTSLSQGNATYYNDKYMGKLTSSTEILDANSFTCAHSSYPMGTLLKITNPATNDAVVVRVNDKQPKTSVFIATVTRRSAEMLGMLEKGKGGQLHVTVEMVQGIPVGKWEPVEEPGVVVADFGTDDVPQAVSIANMPPPSAIANGKIEPKAALEQSVPVPISYKKLGVKTVAAKPAPAATEPPETTDVASEPEAIAAPKARLTANEDAGFKLKMVQYTEKTLTPSGFGIQMGAMETLEKAIELVAKLNNKDKISNVLITPKCESTNNLYKILVGPFEDLAVAKQYSEACKKNHVDCFVVDLVTMLMVK